jgi:hypothetical protein
MRTDVRDLDLALEFVSDGQPVTEDEILDLLADLALSLTEPVVRADKNEELVLSVGTTPPWRVL